jgi:hypothetical protein
MKLLVILDAVLSLLQGTLVGLGLNDKYRKVASEIQAAIERIAAARREVLTNTELETLRNTLQWTEPAPPAT